MKVKIRFELDTSHLNRSGEALILLYMSYGYKEYNQFTKKTKYIPLKLSTKYSIHPDNWDANVYRPFASFSNKKKTIKYALDSLENECSHQLDYFIAEHKRVPSPKELKELIEIKLERKVKPSNDIRIIDHIDMVIGDNEILPSTSQGKIQEDQVAKYRTIQKLLAEYEEGKGCQVTAATLNKEIYLDIWNYLNEKYKQSKKNNYGYLATTVSKNSKTLKAILRSGNRLDEILKINLNDKDLNFREGKTRDAEIFLSEEELELIINSPTLKKQSFIHARNYLILCSFTSLRFDDMMKLHECQVEEFESNGTKFKGFFTPIRKGTKPGEKIQSCIPIFKPVQNVLEELDGKFPKFPINSKLNSALKEFGKHIGLNRVCTTESWYYQLSEPVIEKFPIHRKLKCHLGRGTFISNLLNLGLQESDFNFITHPLKKSGTIQIHYDKRSQIDKAGKLVHRLTDMTLKSLYSLA
jgi:hypothetical protein